MEEWKQYRLGDVISIASGFAYKGDLIGKGDSYLLSMGCVSFNENFLDKGARPYDGDCPERFYAKPGDIVLATRQQSDNLPILGMPAVIPSKYKENRMIVGANLYRVVIKDETFDNRFLFWLLKTPAYVEHIRSCQSGTTVRMITKSNIEDFVFYAPEKYNRDRISDFLWTLDNKIEVNRRINDNLPVLLLFLIYFVLWLFKLRNDNFEQQAQALFDKLFPKITKGDSTIGNMITPQRGKGLLSKNAVSGDVPVVAGGIEPATYHNIGNTTPPVLTIAASGANAGYVNLWHKPVWSSDSSYIDASMTDNVYFWYVMLKKRQKEIFDAQVGSAQPHIYPKHIAELPMHEVKEDELSYYSKIVTPLFKQIGKNMAENDCLASIRDALLPKLMSGELKINELSL